MTLLATLFEDLHLTHLFANGDERTVLARRNNKRASDVDLAAAQADVERAADAHRAEARARKLAALKPKKARKLNKKREARERYEAEAKREIEATVLEAKRSAGAADGGTAPASTSADALPSSLIVPLVTGDASRPTSAVASGAN